jgi:hypothetical protein
MRSWLDFGAVVFALSLGGAGAACSSSGDAASPASTPDAGTSTPLSSIPGRDCPDKSPLTYQSFGEPFFFTYCTGCHSSKLEGEKRQKAPPGVDFDMLAGVRANLRRIYDRAADDHTTMPPAGGPSMESRKLLGDWLACGAPGDEVKFSAPSLPPKGPVPAECDGHPTALPAALMPRCSAETWDCLAKCDVLDFGCDNRCIAADTTPPDPQYGITCSSCINYQEYVCSDQNGCHDVNAALECCRRAKCLTSTDPNCLVRSCTSEAYAYGYCLGAVTPTCSSLVLGPARGCFPATVAPRDAGAD